MSIYKKTSEYRKIAMPTCPFCGTQQAMDNSYNFGRLVDQATGWGSSNVVIKCDHCGQDYRVTCSIRFFGSKKV